MSSIIRMMTFFVHVPDNMPTKTAKRLVSETIKNRKIEVKDIGKIVIRPDGRACVKLRRAGRVRQEVELNKRRDALAWCD